MIGERQGYQSPAGYPAIDPAKDKTIGKIGVRGTSCDNKGIVFVCCLQRFEPVCTMEHRTSRVALDEGFPPRIRQRVDLIDVRRGRIDSCRTEKICGTHSRDDFAS